MDKKQEELWKKCAAFHGDEMLCLDCYLPYNRFDV